MQFTAKLTTAESPHKVCSK